jgi:DNA-binding NtrC family response regulator
MNATATNMVGPGSRKVLLIDDDPDYLTILRMAIKGIPGLETTSAGNAEKGLEQLDNGGEAYDLVLTDLHLPGRSGIEFIISARERGFRAPILVLTAHGSVAAAVEALKVGAEDYLQKPVEPERLRAIVQKLLDAGVRIKPDQTDPMLRLKEGVFEGILGVSPAMREVFDRIDRVARTDATVLIVGESGTGKELVARAIHNRSERKHGPFVPVHTGAIPRDLIASELFGHEKGSFTGAVTSADGKFDAALRGTLFLDEIGTMELAVQVSLLRVLETFKFTRVGGRKERDADVRIVAATNRDLLEMVKEGTFREDLYYRLNVFTIALPPLRERMDDIALIAQHYLTEFATRYRTPARRLSQGALERLYAHPWPGNVRELRNVMEQTAVFARGEEVQADEVQLVSTHVIAPAARATQAMTSAAAAARPPSDHPPTPVPGAPPLPSMAPPAVPQHALPVSPLLHSSPPARDAAAPTPTPSYGAGQPATEARPREGSASVRPAPIAAAQPAPSPLAPFAAVARSTLGAIAAIHSDDALVLRFPIGTTVEAAEKQLILRTLEVIGGNKQKAARVLGISRRCLYNKLASYGISTSPSHEDEAHDNHEDTVERASAKA